MTLVDLEQRRRRPPAQWADAQELRAAARERYAAAVEAGEELSAADLGGEFDRSARWGRDRIAEVAAAAATEDVEDDVAVEAPTQRRPWYAWPLTVAVGVIAMVASYLHAHELTVEANEPALIAWSLPATVDLLLIAALWAGRRGRWWFRLALVVSLAANITAAEPTPIGYAVAAWPPVALFGCHRLLYTTQE